MRTAKWVFPAFAFYLCVPSVGVAQGGLLKHIKEKLAQTADSGKKAVSHKVDSASKALTDTAVNRAERIVRCFVEDKACIKKARDAGQSVIVTNAQGKAVSSSDSAAALSAAALSAASPTSSSPLLGEGAWANYDFVPGDRVIFAEDFAHDRIGDFPQRLEFKTGNMEVVEWQGGRYLRSLVYGAFYIPLPEVLPDRFTVELEYGGPGGQSASLSFVEGGEPDIIAFSNGESGIESRRVQAHGAADEDLRDKIYTLRVMVDRRYAKVYMNAKRVANVPNAELGRSNKIYVTLPPSGTKLIGNIRIAAGGADLYGVLTERGRVATQGILFATGSDEIRPESTPTLNTIVNMLREHPDLRLTIEGHTDNVGDGAANQALSERRAAAVKRFVGAAGIDAARLTTVGFGATKPIAPNTTAEGRQNNRRVELVKS